MIWPLQSDGGEEESVEIRGITGLQGHLSTSSENSTDVNPALKCTSTALMLLS